MTSKGQHWPAGRCFEVSGGRGSDEGGKHKGWPIGLETGNEPGPTPICSPGMAQPPSRPLLGNNPKAAWEDRPSLTKAVDRLRREGQRYCKLPSSSLLRCVTEKK